MNIETFFSLLKQNKSINLMGDLKSEIIKLTDLLKTENTKKSNEPFNEIEIVNYFSEVCNQQAENFIKTHNIDTQDCDIGISNKEIVLKGYESLINKSLHNVFFKCSINEYKEENKESIFVSTKLYKSDQIFENKCEKYKNLKAKNLNCDQEMLFYDKKYKVFYDILNFNSSSEKLNSIVSFYRILFDEYGMNIGNLVKYSVYFILKINCSRLRSNYQFIKMFRLKILISNEEDLCLTILGKAIELIENEFGLKSRKTDKTNNLINLKDPEILINEMDKKEMLDKKFLSSKTKILSPIGKL